MNIYMIFDIKDNSCIDFSFAQFEKSITELPISPWDRRCDRVRLKKLDTARAHTSPFPESGK